MNDYDNTNARVRTFFLLVIVFGIALFVLSMLNQPSMKTTYLPVLVRPTTLSQSQLIYPPPHANLGISPVRAQTISYVSAGIQLYRPWRSMWVNRQWM